MWPPRTVARTSRRRWPGRLLAFAALAAALFSVVAIVQAAQRSMDCTFDRTAWSASRAERTASAARHERSGWPATQLVECPQILHGRSRAQVKALLGPADDDRNQDAWTYDLGVVGSGLLGTFKSDMPTLSVSFDGSHRVVAVTAVGADYD